ncbi:MAG: hypothetical protein P4L53_13250 [Candidatus Obscuribacterales bacterium]|nr:hypothetical protein [Candidatus Obscuribacterales bacterium]
MAHKISSVRLAFALVCSTAIATSFLTAVSSMAQQSRAEKFAKFQEIMQNRKAATSTSPDDHIVVLLQDWTDTARNRTLPVKIYQPKSAGPYPVVIFSHGLGGSRESASYFGAAMANNGYLCLALQHPGSDTSVWMDSLQKGQGDIKEGVLSDMRKAASPENLRLRVDDVKFVLNELERLNASAGEWHHRLDLTKIGCSGHSFGAGTTMAIAGQNYGFGGKKLTINDPRVKAVLYMSPPVNLRGRDPKVVYDSIKIPGMLMTGTEDKSPINDNSAADRLIPFENIAAPDQYLVNFNGGDHMIFSGRNLRGEQGRDAVKDEHFHALINKLSLAFFDAYLKGDQKQKQWLKQSAAEYLGNAAEFKCK